MSARKIDTISIRTTPEIKHLLRLLAEHERRSIASMVEIMVLDYVQKHNLCPETSHKTNIPKGSDNSINRK